MAQNFKPKVGKNVLESLTVGMYDDARFIFREYVQNAADQIDVAVENEILASRSAGRVEINIEVDGKRISIADNATGIKSEDVLKFLGDVANSEKDQTKRKGFRGIGRLGGLGYCEKLIFETTYKNEKVKSIMTLDANQLRKILQDRNDNADAAAVISVITDIELLPETASKHYFKVTMEAVTTAKVLDESSVRDYLSMVAPVPFHEDFTFVDDIKKHYKKNNVILDEYNITLNGDQVFKKYQNNLVEKETLTPILGIDFFEVRDNVDELIALGWFGFRDLSNIVLSPENKERGIRLRKSNIQIGDETTLSRFFKIERTNSRFIGELHAVSPFLIPNARRDYFNDNKTLQTFEERLKAIFESENWENRIAQTASNIHNRVKEVLEYKAIAKDFNKRKGNFASQAEENHYLTALNKAKAKAVRAKKELDKVYIAALKDTKVKTLYDHITAGKNLEVDSNDPKPKTIYNPPKFKKLSKKEADLVLDIFDLIEKTLDFKSAENLKKKIIDRYN